MRILHVVGIGRLPRRPEEEAVGGTSRVILELARVQRALGHEVWVAATVPERWTTVWNGIRLIGLGTRRWARFRLGTRTYDLRAHLDAMALTRVRRFDVVHAHEYECVRYLSTRARVVHVHNSPEWSGTMDPKRLASRARLFWSNACGSDAQVGVSRFVAAQLSRGYASIRATPLAQRVQPNVHTVYNGVNGEWFRATGGPKTRAALRREWGIGEEEIVFLFAGAVAPDKGVVHLARAFSALADEVPGIHLAVAGGAALWSSTSETVQQSYRDYEAFIRQLLAPLRHARRAHFLGLVRPDRMPAVYAASDVVVVPSVVHEAFGLSIIEAFASGKSVIASRVGGIPELVKDDCGILVPPAADMGLAGAMRLLVQDPYLRARLEARAAEAASQFSWERSARQLDALYTSILTGGALPNTSRQAAS